MWVLDEDSVRSGMLCSLWNSWVKTLSELGGFRLQRATYYLPPWLGAPGPLTGRSALDNKVLKTTICDKSGNNN